MNIGISNWHIRIFNLT